MKKIPILLAVLFASQIAFSQTTWYVHDKANGKGDGTTWADAFPKLQDALRKAKYGDRVNVAGGVYRPDNHRDSSFVMKNGVLVIGRYCPGGAAACDVEARTTVLSGDIGRVNDSTDNCYNVVRATGLLDDNSGLLGFNIEKGFANGTATDPAHRRCGAGMYVHTTANNNMTIKNLVFSQNYATDKGGQLYANLTEKSTVIFPECSFHKSTGGVHIETKQKAPFVRIAFSDNWIGNTNTGDSALLNIVALNSEATVKAICAAQQNKTRLSYLCKIASEGDVEAELSSSSNHITQTVVHIVGKGEVKISGTHIENTSGYTKGILAIKAPIISIGLSSIHIDSSAAAIPIRLDNTSTQLFRKISIINSDFHLIAKPLLFISDDISIDGGLFTFTNGAGTLIQKGIDKQLVSFSVQNSSFCVCDIQSSSGPLIQSIFDHQPTRVNYSFGRTVFDGLGRKIFVMPVFNNVVGSSATTLSSVVRSEWLYCTLATYGGGIIGDQPFQFTGQQVGNTGRYRIAQATFNSCVIDYPAASSNRLLDIADPSYIDFRYNLTRLSCSTIAATGRIACHPSNIFNNDIKFTNGEGLLTAAFTLSSCSQGINKGDTSATTLNAVPFKKSHIRNGAPDIGALERLITLDAPKQLSLCSGQLVDSLFKGNACKPYHYQWNGGGRTGTGLENIVANGRYHFTITDAVGVQHFDTIEVRMNSALDFTVTINANSASFTRTVGGTPPYTYRWSDGSTATSRTGLSIGTYTVTITDAKGCSLVVGVPITTVSAKEQPEERFSARLFPNPTPKGISPILQVEKDGLVAYQVHDMLGRLLHKANITDNAQPIRLPSTLSKGMYHIELFDQHGKRYSLSWCVQ